MSVKDRSTSLARAKRALAHLEQHPDTTRTQLGNARDLLNRVANWSDQAAINDALYGLDCIVVDVYGEIPDSDRNN